MKKHNFQILTKEQQATITGGGQMCSGSFAGYNITVVNDNGYHFMKVQGIEPEIEITAREAENACYSIGGGGGDIDSTYILAYA